jgi:hypothetical protein
VKEEKKPKTLVELFREERARGYVQENDETDPLGVLDREEENAVDRRLVDPFYGPIGQDEGEDGDY